MALADAVKSIADEMDMDANQWVSQRTDVPEHAIFLLRGYARTLRTLIQATAGQSHQSTFMSPEYQHGIEIEKARAEMREQKEKAIVQEKAESVVGGGSMLEAIGGPVHGSFVPCDPLMPKNARVPLSGAVYVNNGKGQILFDEELTKQMRERK